LQAGELTPLVQSLVPRKRTANSARPPRAPIMMQVDEGVA